MKTKYEPLAHASRYSPRRYAGADRGAVDDEGQRRKRQQHFERVVIDEADQRAIEEVPRQDSGQQAGDEPGTAIERKCRQRPHREHGEHADDRRHDRRNALDVVRRGVAALRDKHSGGDDGVEQRRNRHVLPIWRGVGIDGDAVRKVADLALGQPHVIPRVGLQEIHARAAEHIVPRRPHAQAGGHHQDDGQHDDIKLSQAG